jgi:hypothetical protein
LLGRRAAGARSARNARCAAGLSSRYSSADKAWAGGGTGGMAGASCTAQEATTRQGLRTNKIK